MSLHRILAHSFIMALLMVLLPGNSLAASNEPINALEMTEAGRKAATMGERTLMPRLRALRSYRLSGVAEARVPQPLEQAMAIGEPEPEEKKIAPIPLAERNAGKMYSPSLYESKPPVVATPAPSTEAPYVYDATKEPPPANIADYQAPVIVPAPKESVTVFNGQATPAHAPAPKEMGIYLDGNMPPLTQPLSEPMGQPPLSTAAAPLPMPKAETPQPKPAPIQIAEREEGGFFSWLFGLFSEPNLENHARPHLPRTATITNRDEFYIRAMRNYPGQPFAKYARHVLDTGVSATSDPSLFRPSTSVTIPVNNAYAFAYRVRTPRRPMFYDDTNEPFDDSQPIVAPEAALTLTSTATGATSPEMAQPAIQFTPQTEPAKPVISSETVVLTEVPKDLGTTAIPFSAAGAPKPVTTVTVPEKPATPPSLSALTEMKSATADEVPPRLGTTAIPFKRPAPKQEEIARPMPVPSTTATISADRRWGIFASTDMRFGEEELVRDAPSTDTDGNGVTVGLDYRVKDGTYAGLALSYARSSFSTGETSDTTANSYSMSLYGTTNYLKSGYVDGFISVGFSSFDSDRTFTAGVNDVRTASGDPSAFFLSGDVETGYDLREGPWKFGPYASMKFAYVDIGSFDEEGAGDRNLKVTPSSDVSVIGSVGIGGSHRAAIGNSGAIIPAFRIALNHEFGDAQARAKSQLLTVSSAQVTTEGVKRSRTWLSLNPSVTAELSSRWALHAQYVRDVFRDGDNENTVNFGASYKW